MRRGRRRGRCWSWADAPGGEYTDAAESRLFPGATPALLGEALAALPDPRPARLPARRRRVLPRPPRRLTPPRPDSLPRQAPPMPAVLTAPPTAAEVPEAEVPERDPPAGPPAWAPRPIPAGQVFRLSGVSYGPVRDDRRRPAGAARLGLSPRRRTATDDRRAAARKSEVRDRAAGRGRGGGGGGRPAFDGEPDVPAGRARPRVRAGPCVLYRLGTAVAGRAAAGADAPAGPRAGGRGVGHRVGPAPAVRPRWACRRCGGSTGSAA